MKTNLEIFSSHRCKLGEGLLWHSERESLFWLDINESKLFEKSLESNKKDFDNSWQLPEQASSLFEIADSSSSIAMVTDTSFGIFDLNSSKYQAITYLPYTEDFRSNDGGVAPNGDIWFGSMQRSPNATKGAIYSIDSQGKLTHHFDGIGIPNTFCWLNGGTQLVIADSLRQTQLKYDWDERSGLSSNNKVFSDYSQTKSTPDGGAVDNQGNLWNALWGGNKVVVRNSDGSLLNELQLPILQPSNCCFGGTRFQSLFITSAMEGMNKHQLEMYPLSGCVFKVELDVAGEPINLFQLDELMLELINKVE